MRIQASKRRIPCFFSRQSSRFVRLCGNSMNYLIVTLHGIVHIPESMLLPYASQHQPNETACRRALFLRTHPSTAHMERLLLDFAQRPARYCSNKTCPFYNQGCCSDSVHTPTPPRIRVDKELLPLWILCGNFCCARISNSMIFCEVFVML